MSDFIFRADINSGLGRLQIDADQLYNPSVQERVTFTGELLVVSGFSGAGKDAVAKILVEQDGWEMVVTHNAGRGPRPGEQDGVDYHFVSEEEFIAMKESGEFLEYVQYAETLKGTAKREIVEKLGSGRRVIWRIDPTAAARVSDIIREKMDQEVAEQLLARTVVVFLKAESEEVLLERARKRNKDGDVEKIQQRIQQDREIWEQLADRFPNVVVNREGALEETVEAIRAIVSGFLV